MEDEALKWWHVRWRLAGRAIYRFSIVAGKVLGVICAVAAIGWGVIYLLSPWLAARRMGEFDPRMIIVPVNSPNDTAALSGSSVEHYGFGFLLPAGAFRDGIESKYMTMMWFRNGGLEFHNPSDDEDWFFLKTIQDDKDATELISRDVLHSKFLLMQAAMSTTPEQVKWWRLRSEGNKTKLLLLMAKFSGFTQIDSPHALAIRPIYTITIGNFRGFQFGNLNNAPYDAHLDLFDKADRHLRFDVTGPEGHGPVLTQAEMNSLIASIRPTDR